VELHHDAGTLRRHWRMVAGLALVVGGLVAVRSLQQTPVYEATASVLVRPLGATSIETGRRPDQVVSMAGEQRIMQSEAVAAIAGRKLGVTATPPELLEHVSVDVPADSQILRVHFRSADPRTAERGADAFAQAYLAFKKEDVGRRVTNSRAGLQRQIATLAGKKAEQDAIAAPDSSATPDQRRSALELSDSYSKQQAELEQQLATLEQLNLSPGTVIEPAELPTSAASRVSLVRVGLGLLLGLVVGILAAFLWDRTDTRLRGPGELTQRLGRPILGQIPKLRRRRPGLAMLDQPDSAAADAYRRLRARLTEAAGRLELTSVMVVSPGPGEGKSTTAANLAVAAAESGREVLLVSADLRRPTIHELFGLPNTSGLSDILLDGLPETVESWPTDDRRRNVLQLWSAAPHLWILTSGPSPQQPWTLLDSTTMRQLLKEQGDLFDLILLDCPPALAPDSLALASLVDGVLLVADAKQTNRSAVSTVHDELDHLGDRLIGSVLNRAPRGRQRLYV
jgi:capsular exopolysaccharide synthesis family protein